jgi:hypothetical protein
LRGGFTPSRWNYSIYYRDKVNFRELGEQVALVLFKTSLRLLDERKGE